MELTGKQRKHLKSLAHHLEPVVRVGKGQVSQQVVSETVRTFEAHELIKVRVDADQAELRKQLAAELAAQAGAQLVGTVGKIAILYRAHPEKPKIKLP